MLARSVITSCILGVATLLASPARAQVSAPADAGLPAPAGLTLRVPLPSFAQTPNIAAAAAARLGTNPTVRGVVLTNSGLQIYRCDRNAAGVPTWSLRSPFAEFSSTFVGFPASNAYHARSDFGGLVTDDEQRALGLLDAAGVRATAPIWQFSFFDRASQRITRRETVAGRVVAQDAPSAADIPLLLIEVRGRAVTTIRNGVVASTSSAADRAANPVAGSEYLLRWQTRDGLAPAAASCTAATIGAESQSPYSALYYFITPGS